jgi:hypothetical protein
MAKVAPMPMTAASRKAMSGLGLTRARERGAPRKRLTDDACRLASRCRVRTGHATQPDLVRIMLPAKSK